jgi:hypothetical protein
MAVFSAGNLARRGLLAFEPRVFSPKTEVNVERPFSPSPGLSSMSVAR